ncbi:uncharacterized protein LOC133890742 isoform X2 [Phragmites australis]|uniref:uncharacterized protein LOC133890742 isoform X2 n=1 Tax=Phragmites australis TaxID=29695 RepID=UPI002D79B7F0|nr:uncharacterized protein LOC133890742 isoform X2 [Phragmites australis]
MASSPHAPRRFLFDLNVAQEEFDEGEEEPEEALEEEVVQEEQVVVEQPEGVVDEEKEQEVVVVEPEEVIMEEDAAEEVIMGEEEAVAPAAEEEVVKEGKGKRKRKDYEVFVGGLPLDAAEEDVARALAEAGDIEEVRLARDPADPRLNRGFAFVRFAAAWQARWAANDLRTAVIKGKACGICKNSENETLHLRNICFDWSKDDLAEKLKPFELENLDRINLIEHPERKGKNRGYAFLDFRTHVDAVAGFLKLQKEDLYLGTDFRAHVSFSNTLSQDDEVMEKVKSVFLDGLPPHWDEDKVREMFGKFGEIDNIQLARNMFTAKRKDFGFIGFTTRQSALDCIKMINKDGVGEGSGKVHMKATLQRPKPTFKKPSWQGASSMLVRRGFVNKSSSGRGHHSDRYRHFGHERLAYSDNYARYHHSMDVEERPVSIREYRAYYRRDSAVHASSHKYGRTHPGARIREAYAESRYSNKYPKHRHAMHEEPMERDAYRRSKYGHSYQERANRISCPECNLSAHNGGAYQSCEYPNGEEFSATSGCEHAYYKTDHDLTPSTSLVSHCEDSCCKVMPSSSSVMCDCSECCIEQEPTPSSSEHARTRSNPQAPLHHRLVKPSHEHRRLVPDEHSAYEVMYTVRESRGRYLSSGDPLSSHSRKHHRPAR